MELFLGVAFLFCGFWLLLGPCGCQKMFAHLPFLYSLSAPAIADLILSLPCPVCQKTIGHVPGETTGLVDLCGITNVKLFLTPKTKLSLVINSWQFVFSFDSLRKLRVFPFKFAQCSLSDHPTSLAVRVTSQRLFTHRCG